MPIATTNLVIEQGSSYLVEWTWEQGGEPVDLTGYEVRGMVRKAPNTEVLLNLGTYLTLGGESGTVTLNIPDTVTAGLSWSSRVCYDIELESSGGTTYRFLEGTVSLRKEITHD
jgi:hypothetical protein